MDKYIKIGIIDSGIAIEHRLFKNIRFKEYSVLSEKVVLKEDHGTGVFDVVRKTLNFLKKDFKKFVFYDIQVFDKKTNIQLENVIKGIQFAIDNKIDIINLSLGFISIEKPKELYDICKKAYKKGCIIVTSFDNKDRISYPAAFPFCMGITAGIVKRYDRLYIENVFRLTRYVGRGNLQRVASVNNTQIFKGGTSYATGHVTGLVAHILDVEGKLTLENLKKSVEKYYDPSIKSFSDLPSVNNNKKDLFNRSECNLSYDHSIVEKILNGKKNYSNTNVSIYPCSNKEFDCFSKFKNKCLVNVIDYIDFPIKTYKYNRSDDPVNIKQKIEQLSDRSEHLIVGYPFEIAIETNIKFYIDLIKYFQDRKKDITFLEAWVKNATKKIFPDLKDYSTINIDRNDIILLEELGKIKNNKITKPVLGVLGSSPRVGKFTCQLYLKNELEKVGYKVGWLSTESQGYYFGADYCFPFGVNGSNDQYIKAWGSIISSIMFSIEKRVEPDILISGHQSGLIPFTKDHITIDKIRNLAFLSGLKPDAVICIFSMEDEADHIDRIIKSIEYYFSIPIICLILNPMKRIFFNNRSDLPPLYTTEISNQNEWDKKASEITSKTKYKVFGLNDKFVNQVINYFGE